MLRITINDRLMEQRWILQGRLTVPWVAELDTALRKSRSAYDTRKWIVDLTDVTLIDASGEEVLRTMGNAGAEFIACGVYVKHLVELITSECQEKLRSKSGGR